MRPRREDTMKKKEESSRSLSNTELHTDLSITSSRQSLYPSRQTITLFNEKTGDSTEFSIKDVEMELIDYVKRGQSTLVKSMLNRLKDSLPQIGDISDVDGNPLICIALQQKDNNTACALVEYHVNVHVADSQGKTPLDYAKLFKIAPEVLSVLKQEKIQNQTMRPF